MGATLGRLDRPHTVSDRLTNSIVHGLALQYIKNSQLSCDVDQTVFKDFSLIQCRLTGENINKSFLHRYINMFSDDFTKFVTVDGCYLCTYPYMTYAQPLVLVPPGPICKELVSKAQLVHCKSSFEYFDVLSPDLTTIKNTRWFAQTIHELRKRKDHIPAKKYHMLTVSAVSYYGDDGSVVNDYVIEKLIILPCGIVSLYVGHNGPYLHKNNESIRYDLGQDPIYRGYTFKACVPQHKPVKSQIQPDRPKEKIYYQRDYQTEMSGCCVS